MRMRSPSRVCFGMEWDWGNPGLFGGKDSEISVSELGNGSSRSNISASVDSSAKAGGARVSGLSFTGTSAVAASVGKPLIGLKLGKRTYFEDVCAGNNSKGSADSASGTPSAASVVKKAKVSTQNVQSSHCQVEGCDVDLSGAKDYHRKHRVCETHSKSSKVIIAGQERRFCQQCSRFHDLSEFDQKKRSCRRRLSDHNARRRKPQTGAISFNSSRPFTSFYDEQQMNFVLDRAPFGHGRSTASSTWENSCCFSLTHTKGSCIKSAKPGGVDGRLHFSNSQLSDTLTTLPHNVDKLLSFKGTTEVLNQGLEASITRNMDGAVPHLHSALSLLSTDSWSCVNPTQTNFAQYVTSNHSGSASNSMPGFWQDEQHLSQQARASPLDHLHSNGSQFQEFQLFKAPHEMTFFDSSHMLSKPDGQFLEFKT